MSIRMSLALILGIALSAILGNFASADRLDLYVVSREPGTVYVVDGDTGILNPAPLITGLDAPNYALLGPNNTLYIAENTAVRRYDAATGAQLEPTFFELGRRTNGMDFDSAGNLYVMIRDSAVASAVIAIAPDGTGLGKAINDINVDSGQDVVVGLASGNLYTTAADFTSVTGYNAAGGTGAFQWPVIGQFGPDPGPTFTIQEGPDGNLYGIGGDDILYKLDGTSGSVLQSVGVSGSGGLARSLGFDEFGNVYVGFGFNGTPNVQMYNSSLVHQGEVVSSGLLGDNTGISLVFAPEPSALTLLSVGVVGLLRRRR